MLFKALDSADGETSLETLDEALPEATAEEAAEVANGAEPAEACEAEEAWKLSGLEAECPTSELAPAGIFSASPPLIAGKGAQRFERNS